MQVAFYKGRSRLFNRAVSWWLRGPYSHCELVLGTDASGRSICLSSSFMDGGVRVKYMRLDPAHWDIVNVAGDSAMGYAWAAAHEGQGYDLLGLLGFVWRRQTGQQARWFCSEVVASVLGFPEPWRLDPCALWAVLTQREPLTWPTPENGTWI